EGDAAIARLSGQSRARGGAGHFASIRLGELVTAALADRRVVDSRRLLDRLLPPADDVGVEDGGGLGALKAAFLVGRTTERRFDRALDKLAAAEAPRLVFTSIGPLPPTAFAALRAAT